MNKTKLIEYFKRGGSIKVISPQSHKYYNIERKAEKIQTNSLRFEGGSWLFFRDIKPEKVLRQGFIMGEDNDRIEYIFCNMDLIKEIEAVLK